MSKHAGDSSHKSHLSQGPANGGSKSKATGSQLDQQPSQGHRNTPSARWGTGGAKRDVGNASLAGDNTTPPRAHVAGKNTPERGGGGRRGHTAGRRVGKPSGSKFVPPGKT